MILKKIAIAASLILVFGASAQAAINIVLPQSGFSNAVSEKNEIVDPGEEVVDEAPIDLVLDKTIYFYYQSPRKSLSNDGDTEIFELNGIAKTSMPIEGGSIAMEIQPNDEWIQKIYTNPSYDLKSILMDIQKPETIPPGEVIERHYVMTFPVLPEAQDRYSSATVNITVLIYGPPPS